MTDQVRRLLTEKLKGGPGWTMEYLQTAMLQEHQIDPQATWAELLAMKAIGEAVTTIVPGTEAVDGRELYCLPEHH